MAVRRLSGGCQETVKRLSVKNHHIFEAKIKFGRWFRYHRRAYSTPEGIHGFRGASWRGLVRHVFLIENTTIVTTISLALDRYFCRYVDT